MIPERMRDPEAVLRHAEEARREAAAMQESGSTALARLRLFDAMAMEGLYWAAVAGGAISGDGAP